MIAFSWGTGQDEAKSNPWMKRRILIQCSLAAPLALLISVGWLRVAASPEEAVDKSKSQIVPSEVAAASFIKLPGADSELIQLPIRVHLLTGFEMEKDGETMGLWVTAGDLEERVLPEINRIWRPANIQWVFESISVEEIDPKGRHGETIAYISKSTRETKDRTKRIKSLIDPKRLHPTIHNLYLLPYVGSTTQGFASFGGGVSFKENPNGGNYCFVGVWSNKPSGGKKPPQRFPLVEEGGFEIGSVSRTCSHELGHNLLLPHPDKATQTIFNRLMGGRRHGYGLTEQEVALARKVALGRAARILRGVPQGE